MEEKRTGIIIGRFQVKELHLGHLQLIATALRECDTVVIVLGISKEEDERNPFSSIKRQLMISKIFPQISFWELWDMDSDKLWSMQVDEIGIHYSNPILYHSRDSFKDHYLGKLPLREVEEVKGYSGTEERSKI